MKSLIIEIDEKDLSREEDKKLDNGYVRWYIHVPILPAFSVEYFIIDVNGLYTTTTGGINENKIILEQVGQYFGPSQTIRLIIHYHGIRDYSLLFPWINDEILRNRIGKFYEEAEKSFDQGAWLSFALMCGAVFEGMLYAILDMTNNNKFYDMINEAYEKRKIINSQQKQIINDVRVARNLIHANNFGKDYITRKKAMDIMTTLNKLIKQFASQTTPK